MGSADNLLSPSSQPFATKAAQIASNMSSSLGSAASGAAVSAGSAGLRGAALTGTIVGVIVLLILLGAFAFLYYRLARKVAHLQSTKRGGAASALDSLVSSLGSKGGAQLAPEKAMFANPLARVPTTPHARIPSAFAPSPIQVENKLLNSTPQKEASAIASSDPDFLNDDEDL
jgi:hypothetical protein